MNTDQHRQEQDVQAVVARQAAEWFVAHRDGPLAARERTAFTAWLRTSPLHVSEYLAVAALARGFNALPDEPGTDMQGLLERARLESDRVVTLSPPASGTEAPVRIARPARPGRIRHWALAASLGAVMLAAAPWLLQESARNAATADIDLLRTAHGEQRVWRLPDGSVVHLNSGSELKVRFSGTQRIVEVDHGQAKFDVAPDPQRPFRVVAGDTAVVAIGTSFDVYRKSDATVVTVLTGKVAVYRNAGMTPVRLTGEAAERTIVSPSRPLTAGEQVKVLNTEQPEVAAPIIDHVDISKVAAWTQQQIMFEQEPLAAVAAEFNRYGRVPIEVEGAALNDLRITGIFNAYDTESFVGFLRRLDNVRVTATAGSIRVRKDSGT